MSNKPFLEYVFTFIDHFTEETMPGGIPNESSVLWIYNMAFDHYVSKYGVPSNANAARHMFEWASSIETSLAVFSSMAEERDSTTL